MTMIINPYTFGFAFPQFKSYAKSANPSGTVTSLSATTPTYASGDLLVLMLALSISTTTVTLPSGWTLSNSTTFGSGHRSSVYYKVADGSEGSSVSIGVDSTQNISAIICSVTAGSFIVPVVIQTTQLGSNRTPSADPPDCPSQTPSAGNGRYMVIASCSVRSDMTFTGYPYSNGDYIQSGGASGNTGTLMTLAACYGTFTGTSVDPAAFSAATVAAARGCIQNTITIKST